MSFLSFSTTKNTKVGGADEVARAIAEAKDDKEKTGVLGEPQLHEVGNYNTELKVRIPVSADVPVAELEFDLPDSDEEGDLDTFLQTLGLSSENLTDVAGTVVPLRYDETAGAYHV
jgi:hypothetical protein